MPWLKPTNCLTQLHCVTRRRRKNLLSGKKISKSSFLVPSEVSRTIQLAYLFFFFARIRPISAWTPSRATLLSPDSSDQRWTARGQTRDPPS